MDKETISKLNGYYFYDENKEELYLDENIILIKKTTGKYYKKGKIIAINENNITIKYNAYFLTLDNQNLMNKLLEKI